MLLDEPFDVDPVQRPGIEARLRDLARRGIAVLFADHNAKGALDVCDRAYVMVEGRIVIEGTAAELLRPRC